MNVIPYSFSTTVLPEPRERMIQPGAMHGVHLTCAAQQYQWLLDKIRRVWFADRNEVILIEHGTTAKLGSSFFILEWEECTIDPLFLAILHDEAYIEDFTLYIRYEERREQ